MDTLITVKKYGSATHSRVCSLVEISQFTTHSLKEAIFSCVSDLGDTTLRSFMSELNRCGVSYLRVDDSLIRISYTGSFPEIDW